MRHYELGVMTEHLNARSGAALVHRSELYAYRLSGTPDALTELCWIGGVASASLGRFGRLTTPGKPLPTYENAILVTLKKDAEWLLLTHEGTPAPEKSEAIQCRTLNPDWVILDAMGPAAAVGLEMGMPHDLVDLPEGGSLATQIDGLPIRIVRHRGLGDDGFYLLAQKAVAPKVWSSLTRQLFKPIGYDAFESLRIEAGLPMPYSEIAPAEAQRSRAFRWVVLTAQERRLLRRGYDITDTAGATIGQVTCGSISPIGRQTHAIGWMTHDETTHEPASALVEVRGQHVLVDARTTPFAADRQA